MIHWPLSGVQQYLLNGDLGAASNAISFPNNTRDGSLQGREEVKIGLGCGWRNVALIS